MRNEQKARPTAADYIAIGLGNIIVGFGRTRDAARSRAVSNGCPNALIVHGSQVEKEILEQYEVQGWP